MKKIKEWKDTMKERCKKWYYDHLTMLFLIFAGIAVSAILIVCFIHKSHLQTVKHLIVAFIAGLMMFLSLVYKIKAKEEKKRKKWQKETYKQLEDRAVKYAEQKVSDKEQKATAKYNEGLELQKEANSVIRPNEAQKKADSFVRNRYNLGSEEALENLKEELTLFETIKANLIREKTLPDHVKTLAKACVNKGYVDEVFDPFRYKYDTQSYATALKEVPKKEIDNVITWVNKKDTEYAKTLLESAIKKEKDKLAEEVGGTGGNIKNSVSDGARVGGREVPQYKKKDDGIQK